MGHDLKLCRFGDLLSLFALCFSQALVVDVCVADTCVRRAWAADADERASASARVFEKNSSPGGACNLQHKLLLLFFCVLSLTNLIHQVQHPAVQLLIFVHLMLPE